MKAGLNRTEGSADAPTYGKELHCSGEQITRKNPRSPLTCSERTGRALKRVTAVVPVQPYSEIRLIQEIQEVGKLDNADVPIACKRKEAPVTRDNDIGLGEEGTFEDPVIRLIVKNV